MKPADLITVVAEVPDATNLVTNPVPSPAGVPAEPRWGAGGAGTTQDLSGDYRRMTWTTPTSGTGGHDLSAHLRDTVRAGRPYSVRVQVRRNRSATARVGLQFWDSDDTFISEVWDTQTLTANVGRVFQIHGAAVPEGTYRVRLLVYMPPSGIQAGDTLDYRHVVASETPVAMPFFSGNTAPDSTYRYKWNGTAHRSTSARVRDVSLVAPGPGGRGASQGGLQAVSTSRGGRPDGTYLSVESGTVTVVLLGDYSHVLPGARLVIGHTESPEPLYTGQVQDSTVTHTKVKGAPVARTTILATDHVSTLQNTMRYGVAFNDQTLTARVNALMVSAPEVTYSVSPTFDLDARHGGIVYESTLGNHLNLAVNTGGVAWWVTRDNELRVASPRGVPHAAGPILTDSSAGPFGTSWPLRYVDIQVSRSTRSLVTAVTVANHGRQPDPDNPGSWLADDHNLGPYVDVDAEDAYGRRAVTIPAAVMTTNPTYPADLVGEFWCRQFRPRRWPTSVRVNALEWLHVAARPISGQLGLTRLNTALSRDIGSPIPVDFDGARYQCYITAIRHQITPETWHVEYDLAPNPHYLED